MAKSADSSIDDVASAVAEGELVEGSLLLALTALFSSALHAVDRGQFGYCLDDGLEIVLPASVWQTLGFTPEPDSRIKTPDSEWRILLTPHSHESRHSYWKLLFPGLQPSLVFSFVVDDTSGTPQIFIENSWLSWPWQLSPEERATALQHAEAASQQLEAEIKWLDLAKVSVNDGNKAALFEGVAAHLAAQAGVDDAV